MEQTNDSGGTTWERPDAPLGTLVYRAGLLSKEKLEAALSEGRQSGRRLGEILLQKGWIEEKDLARLLAGQKSLAFVSLKGRGFDPAVARLLGERMSRFHCALAIGEEAGSVLVAIADPTDDGALSEIGAELGCDVQLVVATASEVRAALDDVFAPAGAPPPPSGAPRLALGRPVSSDTAPGLRLAGSSGLSTPGDTHRSSLEGRSADPATDLAPAAESSAPGTGLGEP